MRRFLAEDQGTGAEASTKMMPWIKVQRHTTTRGCGRYISLRKRIDMKEEWSGLEDDFRTFLAARFRVQVGGGPSLVQTLGDQFAWERVP
jgi:hypothetical protein